MKKIVEKNVSDLNIICFKKVHFQLRTQTGNLVQLGLADYDLINITIN